MAVARRKHGDISLGGRSPGLDRADPTAALAQGVHMTTTATMALDEIQRIEHDHQLPLYAKREIALVRGEGPYLFDSGGRRYLDAMSNYGVAVLGHADPEFTAALTDQLSTLATCHQSFYSDVRAELL